ncbi:hypothetical protein LFM09_07030 [Lentzea alba]|uniref:Vgb family protein n=1 Tax=Lentzea alba TaxID=2714351 RepID=UPI0039BF028F
MARLMFLLAGVLLAGCTSLGPAPPVPSPTPAPNTVTAIKLPDGSFPRSPFVAPDGSVWCSETSGEALGRIDQNGAVTHVRIPGNNNSPAGIVHGPDGLIWFAGFQMIGRVSATGTVTGWRSADVGLPNAIAAGQDNAVWYTNEKLPPAISRITASGAIQHRTLQTTDPLIKLPGLTAGPDQALWFTVTSNARGATHAVGRMPVDGSSYRLFPLPAESGPGTIVAGSDDALWFTTGRGIGRMSTTGDFTEHPVPGDARPLDIATGPDGSLWFTTDQSRIGRITTSGRITMHDTTGAKSLTGGLAVSPDGTLWITDGPGNTVWRYSPMR